MYPVAVHGARRQWMNGIVDESGEEEFRGARGVGGALAGDESVFAAYDLDFEEEGVIADQAVELWGLCGNRRDLKLVLVAPAAGEFVIGETHTAKHEGSRLNKGVRERGDRKSTRLNSSHRC